MVSHLNLRGRSAIFLLFRSRAANFWMSSWDSYRQGSPIFLPMSGWRLQYLFSKFANSCYSGCVRQSCHNLNLMLGVTAFFVCLRRDSPEVVLFVCHSCGNSHTCCLLICNLSWSMFVVLRMMFSVTVPSYLFMCWRPTCLLLWCLLFCADMSWLHFCQSVCVCSVYKVLSACPSIFKSCLLSLCMVSGLLVHLHDVLPSCLLVWLLGLGFLIPCTTGFVECRRRI